MDRITEANHFIGNNYSKKKELLQTFYCNLLKFEIFLIDHISLNLENVLGQHSITTLIEDTCILCVFLF